MKSRSLVHSITMDQRHPLQRSRRGSARATRALRQEQAWRSDFDTDLAAMARVWRMLRDGAVRMLGEIVRHCWMHWGAKTDPSTCSHDLHFVVKSTEDIKKI
jgi:hypothetical protein